MNSSICKGYVIKRNDGMYYANSDEFIAGTEWTSSLLCAMLFTGAYDNDEIHSIVYDFDNVKVVAISIQEV